MGVKQLNASYDAKGPIVSEATSSSTVLRLRERNQREHRPTTSTKSAPAVKSAPKPTSKRSVKTAPSLSGCGMPVPRRERIDYRVFMQSWFKEHLANLPASLGQCTDAVLDAHMVLWANANRPSLSNKK